MSPYPSRKLRPNLAFVLAASLSSTPSLLAQATSTGSITLQVSDPAKAVLPGTQLQLIDKSTNTIRNAVTLKDGNYTFQALTYGHYKLSASHQGFEKTVYDDVTVQAGIATNLDISLVLGTASDTVQISAQEVPVIEASSNTLSTNIDLKQVVNLPILGRDLLQLAFLSPGYAATGASSNSSLANNGTFNGLGQASFQANIDGVNSTSSRGKSGAGPSTTASARVEDIQEFTVQTGELDPSQGAGQSAVQTLFVTNRGTNKFHGRIYEDHQNGGLDANSWTNNANGVSRAKLVLNDFGASVGGPALKDKLFFFGSYSQSSQPTSNLVQATVPTAAAAAGIYSYYTACASATCPVATINVLQAAAAGGYSGAINSAIAAQLSVNQSAYKYGSLTSSSSDLNRQTLSWNQPESIMKFYPSGRLDYVISPTQQLSLSLNYSKQNDTGNYASEFPGPAFAKDNSGYKANRYVISLGHDWTISQTMVNQFKVGFLYNKSVFSPEYLGRDLSTMASQGWSFGLTSGVTPQTPQSSFYPYLTASDNVSWQKGTHNIKFGGNLFREQDHYWNPPVGYPNYSLGVTDLDPVAVPLLASIPTNVKAPSNLTEVQGDVEGLYGVLDGRISGVSATRPYNASTGSYQAYGAFNLDEVLLGGGLYIMDAWKATPTLTLNYGLRWDLIGDDYDRNQAYTGPDVSSLWGPSGVGNLFKPGTLSGNQNPTYTARGHAYNSALINPEPQVGFAWNPAGGAGWLNHLLGDSKSVFRGSFTMKNYTEGGQNFWQYASNGGFNFFQNATLSSDTSGLTGHFTPGSLTLGQTLPAYALTPASFQKTIPMSSLTFNNSAAYALNPNIKQPLVQSWSFGFQRQLGRASAIEIRYVGNHAIRQWLSQDINQVNIAESGFLKDFKAAQANLAQNTAAGDPGDFENHGGGQATPMLTQALGGAGAVDFTNASFVQYLQQGAAGSFASGIAQNPTYFCNLVSTSFAPCAGLTTVHSSSYASNILQANPYVAGGSAYLLNSIGSSNYNSLQIEFRQRLTRGLELNANYAYSKTLGIAALQGNGNISSFRTFYDLHNKNLNYQPSTFDIRNVLHASGTYDLPLGRGHTLMGDNRAENLIAGGWTVGSIVTYQSGAPSILTGGYSTVNGSSDGGVDFASGTSAKSLQKTAHISRSAGNPYMNFLSPKFQGVSSANYTYVSPHSNAGTFGQLNYLYGPKWINTDISATKVFPLHDGIMLNVQGEFLNAFNHPAFGIGDTGVQDSTFGTTSSLLNSPRHIELRANITF